MLSLSRDGSVCEPVSPTDQEIIGSRNRHHDEFERPIVYHDQRRWAFALNQCF
jgi:hypothetical protein